MEPLILDGASGEGGGQILRSALALSLVTGQPFRIERIRANRKRPGLLRQHLTAVQAAAAVGSARVVGAALGSDSLLFWPGAVTHGDRSFAVGTAGSALLVLQTILPPLLLAPGRSRLLLEGGTHNPFAPSFDFLAGAFLPRLRRMGAQVEATLERPGFHPVGGGRLVVDIEGGRALERVTLLERGELVRRAAVALVSTIPDDIGRRELAVLAARLGLRPHEVRVERVSALGPGNALALTLEHTHGTEVITAAGARGVRAEDVASELADEATRFVEAGVPVGEHLADQLLLPMALAGGGAFLTVAPTAHTTTNAAVIERFLPVKVTVEPVGPRFHVDIRGA